MDGGWFWRGCCQDYTCPVDAASGSQWPLESSAVNSVGKEGGQGVRDEGWDTCLRDRGAVGRQLGDLGGDPGSLYVIKVLID